MSDAPKRPTEPITVDDLLSRPYADATRALARYFEDAARRENEAFEAAARERFDFVARGFEGLRERRRKWDPRRLGDRYVERRCRGLVDLSDAAASLRATRPGKIVYSTSGPEDLYASGKVPRVAVDMATRPVVVYYGAGEVVQSVEEAEQAAWWLARLRDA